MENRDLGEYDFDKFAQEVDLLSKVSGQLMKTKHYAALQEAGIFAILQRAKALNINPFEALNGGLYYINGKVGMSTELMASLIRKSGHNILKDPKSNDSICIIHGKRGDTGDEWTCSFSKADAERAGLWKNMFLKYPAIMLYNRAMSMLARQLFPDVIKGAGYEKDELEEIEPNNNVTNWQATPPQISTETIAVPKIEMKITDEMEKELEGLLLQDLDFKDKVDVFLAEKNFTYLSQLNYADFTGLVRNAKNRLKEKK